ncbi:hypothetical protein K525DRAFT_282112 [Schizophyllum commune Loenen D]|nr:hypothetical protein K525DRAFT_282112 [Schizophyllum commune Loenen D]
MQLLVLITLATAVAAVPPNYFTSPSAATASVQPTNVALNYPTGSGASTPGGGDVRLNHPTSPPSASTPLERRLNHPTSPPAVSSPGGGEVKLDHPTGTAAASTALERRLDHFTSPTAVSTPPARLNHPTLPPAVSTPGGGDVRLNSPTRSAAALDHYTRREPLDHYTRREPLDHYIRREPLNYPTGTGAY